MANQPTFLKVPPLRNKGLKISRQLTISWSPPPQKKKRPFFFGPRDGKGLSPDDPPWSKLDDRVMENQKHPHLEL